MAATTRDLTLAAGDNTLSLTVEVDHPPRWWPWRLGAQPQCDVEVVVEVDGVPSDDRRLRTAFREVRFKSWQLTVNGERMFPMGSNHGPTRMALAEATAPELIRDVQLAVDANLDLLRIHAHVTRLELYDAADAAGLLLWQDLPLQWGYARGTRKEAVRQAREMVDLLGHHPSIAMWCAHNEPLALDLQPGDPIRGRDVAKTAVSMFLPSWNKDVLDRSVARALAQGGPHPCGQPALGRATRASAAAGPTRTSTSAGTTARWTASRPRCARCRASRASSPSSARRPSRTLPSFMHPERWPDLDWDDLFEHHALQKRYFDLHVPPDAVRVVRRVARRDPALPGRADPAADRGPAPAPPRPHRRVLPLLLRRRAPVGHVVRARPRSGPEGRVPGARRRLPDGAADARAPDRARSTW